MSVPVELLVLHKSARYTVKLPDGPRATVLVLKQLLERVTRVLVRNQTLIFSGKKLGENSLLSELAFTNGSKLLLLGDAPVVPANAAQPTETPVPTVDITAARVAAWTQTGCVVLRDGGLIHLPPAILELQSRVRTLDFEGNCLDSASLDGLFGRFTALSSLNLRKNGLTSGAWCDQLPSSLISLALDQNQLDTLPEGARMPALVRLTAISNPRLRIIPDSIGLLRLLTFLDVSACSLTTLPAALGLCASLEELRVDDNPGVASLPAQLGACARLALLSAVRCGITRAGVPPSLLRAPLLTKLALTENPSASPLHQL